MQAAAIVVGVALEAGAWWLVASRRRDVWRAIVPALVALGAAAILLGPSWSPTAGPAAAAAVGAATGAVLYAGTRVFVSLVRPWTSFQRHSLAMYLRQGDRSLGWTLVLSVALSVPGEEMFWRGFVQPELMGALDGRDALAAVAAWGLFVAANLPSANLAVIAGAVVGGAVWSGLGWWCGGALAPLASHAVWTTLMLSFPVVPKQELAR
ncbi:MAG: CPBP family glutamic-type intramembrane protease [Actinomycetota bacterium]